MRRTVPLFFSLLFCFCTIAGAQTPQSSEVVRITGVVVDMASSEAIPFVTIKNKSTKGSFVSDTTGYFSLNARVGDTLVFEAMSYRDDEYIVPEDAQGGHLAIIESLQPDAFLLEEITVRGFPSQDEFERAFLSLNTGDYPENVERLNKHVDEVTEDETNMEEYMLDYNYRQRTYWIRGAAPPNHFLNPERWVEFIRNWRDGEFTDESMERLENMPRPAEDKVNPKTGQY